MNFMQMNNERDFDINDFSNNCCESYNFNCCEQNWNWQNNNYNDRDFDYNKNYGFNNAFGNHLGGRENNGWQDFNGWQNNFDKQDCHNICRDDDNREDKGYNCRCRECNYGCREHKEHCNKKPRKRCFFCGIFRNFRCW